MFHLSKRENCPNYRRHLLAYVVSCRDDYSVTASLTLVVLTHASKKLAGSCGQKKGRARGDCAAPGVTSYFAATTWMRRTVSEFGWGVEGGSVTALGECLLAGRWSRVGEMFFYFF
jgi:hypothetical protein